MKRLFSIILTSVIVLLVLNLSSFSTSAISYILGDTDLDGRTTVLDATKIQKVLANLDVDSNGFVALLGDVSEDILDITDASYIQKYLAHISIPFPINRKIIDCNSNNCLNVRAQVVKGKIQFDEVGEWDITRCFSREGLPNSNDSRHYSIIGDDYASTMENGLPKGYCHSNIQNNTLQYNYDHSKATFKWDNWTTNDYNQRVLLGIQDPYDETIKGYHISIKNKSGEYLYQSPVNDFISPELRSVTIDMPIVSCESNKVVILWNAIPNASHYYVYRDKELVSSTLETSYETEVDLSQQYHFIVEAYDKNGNMISTNRSSISFIPTMEWMIDSPEYVFHRLVTYQSQLSVCNKCGADITGKVYRHVITSEELQANHYSLSYKRNSSLSGNGQTAELLTAHFYDTGSCWSYAEDNKFRGVYFSDDTYMLDTEAYNLYLNDYSSPPKSFEDVMNMNMIEFHYLFEGCPGGSWHGEPRRIIIGLEDVFSPESGHLVLSLVSGKNDKNCH